MTNLEKCRRVLPHMSRPVNDALSFTEEEQAACAAIYDDCLAGYETLGTRWQEFWASRMERLEENKATDETVDG